MGFSYSTDANYTSGDDQAAADSRQLVAAFLVLFPEYIGRPAYLAGESYAGELQPSPFY